VLDLAERQAELKRNRQRVRSPEGRALLGKHRQRAEGPWYYAKLYGGLAQMRPRRLLNAWKKALLQGIGWNIMKLIARLTGLTPRGKSALAQPGANTAPLDHYFCAQLYRFFAIAVVWFIAAIFSHGRTGFLSRPPIRGRCNRKAFFSQGCQAERPPWRSAAADLATPRP
jgi:hypothetical protein